MTTSVWTDRPIPGLGDSPLSPAPVRECTLLSSDGDGFVTVQVEGLTLSSRSHVLYAAPGRRGRGEVARIAPARLAGLPLTGFRRRAG